MSTGLLQRASFTGHTLYDTARGTDVVHTDQGSPHQIFATFAGTLGLLAVTGAAFALVAQLAHLINTSWQIF